jgi:SAM-dependent methyltransferase
MDFGNPRVREVFFTIHEGLPRQGPGSRACTAQALEIAGALPEPARVLDIGCGPGMQTLDLAALLPGSVIDAVEIHEPFVEEARSRIQAAGLGDRVTAACGDMTSLPYAPGSFDLIWCEGAAYFMGVANALKAWRPLLRPGGKLALTDAVWLRSNPPDDLHAWWMQGYPQMQDVPANRDLVRQSGYELLSDFVLPAAAWWDDYYGPLEARIDHLDIEHEDDTIVQAVLQGSRREIDFFKRCSDYYGYVFLVMATPEP